MSSILSKYKKKETETVATPEPTPASTPIESAAALPQAPLPLDEPLPQAGSLKKVKKLDPTPKVDDLTAPNSMAQSLFD